MTVFKKAYAKVNLTLEILGTKRSDGYHDIASVMTKAKELYDEVTVETAESGILLKCDKDVCAPEKNLAYIAAERFCALYFEKFGKKFGVSVELKKNIPMQAGLAGGSADAAAVLDALNELAPGLSDEEIDALALSVGSDVPFCLEKHNTALCLGRGEIIYDLPEPVGWKIKIEMPSASLSTAGIYAEYDRLYGDDYSKNESRAMAELIKRGAELAETAGHMCNDFQAICEKRCPEIAELCEKFRSQGYYAQMSGSGSAVFALLLP